jgi:dTDP-4-amino-4,6-dideoxygalactose transaminase
MTAHAASVPRPRVPLMDLTAMHDEVRLGVEDVWRTALERSVFVGGEEVEVFEAAWAGYCARAHCVGVANGTDAIAVTLRALGIGPGDEVIVPANTFIATAEAVLMAGATPRFVDVDPDTHLVSAATILPEVRPVTKAIIVVYLHGNIPDMAELSDLAESSGLALIGDAAQAHGSMWRGRPAGSFGTASCFSFYPGKNLGAFGDAGAVVTDDSDLAARIRSIANHGRAVHSGTTHELAGVNSRLDAIQAGVLSVKLSLLQRWNSQRRLAAAKYDATLSPILDRLAPLHILDEVLPSYHHYVVRTPQREHVRSALAAEGIETGVHYPIPCHLQEPYRSFAERPLPVCERAAWEILSLPIFPHISDDQIALVSSALAKSLNQAVGVHG